jgi:uncharacterized protein (DUF433 family)
MTIPKELRGVLTSTPDTLGGSVRFVGTRVPVQALLDTIICNHTVDYFLEGYPDVTRQQADTVLKWEQNQARQTFGLEMVS